MNKKIYFIFLLFTGTLNAQTDFDTLNFDVTDTSSLITIDSITGCWQIGMPSKTFFNAAFSTNNAMVTDTLNPYSENLNDFVIIHYSPEMFYANLMSFKYQIMSDFSKDGGILEGYDFVSGNWFNLLNGNTIFSSNYCQFMITPVLINLNHFGTFGPLSEFGWTGNSNGWQAMDFQICPVTMIQNPLERNLYGDLLFRFRFISDSIPNNLDGWMIDDISFSNNSFICPSSVIESISFNKILHLSPNPANDYIMIESSVKSFTKVEISDTREKIVISEVFSPSEKKEINVSGLVPGIYFYRIYTPDNEIINGKFIKTSLK